MNLVGLLDRPSNGEIWISGERADNLPDRKRVALRRENIGFVFQNFYLLPELSAWQNVALPMWFSKKAHRKKRSQELLTRLGLAQRLDHLPSELSGGEMQRVAIARALANTPSLILADEPTGKLDSQNDFQVAQLFQELVASGITILMTTHNKDLAAQADSVIPMQDGRLE